MKHLGDICKINGAEVEPVSVIIGGSPCQDLSVAGKRAGLDGARSGLFMEQIRVIKEMRENDRNNGRTGELCRPRYMVWENVPGAFSSNSGEDFRTVLEETARVADQAAVIPRPPKGRWTNAGVIMGNGWSVAWRVLDAQFWGVPQRRRRIALVADFGGTTAPEILFERKGVSGDITESGEPGKDAATDVRSGIEETGRAISFQERAGKPGGGKGILIQDEHIGALSTLNNQSVCVFEPGAASRVGGHVYEDGVAGTVRANAGDNQGKNAKYNFSVEQEKIGAQVAKGPGAIATQSIVRRLTPLECERLQGYPDHWTDIGEWTDSKGKKHKDADSPRYKAIGNSIAIPCWRFILQRISERVQERTMASLFDGIGGFPLIWEEINGSKSCRWVSEIEEFPIAVTKMRFEQE